MVLPDSNRVPRVPLYLGTYSPLFTISLTGLSPSLVRLSSRVQLSIEVGFIARPATPTDPKIDWFGLFPLRSPLLGESLLISLPEGTEMFHFPSYAPLARSQAQRLVGFPIQKLPGRSLLDGSPTLIAVMPRLSSPLDAKASSECP